MYSYLIKKYCKLKHSYQRVLFAYSNVLSSTDNQIISCTRIHQNVPNLTYKKLKILLDIQIDISRNTCTKFYDKSVFHPIFHSYHLSLWAFVWRYHERHEHM